MIESVVALLLFLKGDIVEMTYKERMDLCLKSKRLAEREVNPNNVRFNPAPILISGAGVPPAFFPLY